MLHLILCPTFTAISSHTSASYTSTSSSNTANSKEPTGALKDAIHFLTHNHHITTLYASNAHTFIQELSKILHITSVRTRALVIMNLHVMDKSHQLQLYKLLISNLNNKIILVTNVMPIAQITKLCKIHQLENDTPPSNQHDILQFVKSSNILNREPMHDLIMRLDDEEAHKALLSLGSFFEKCLLSRKQAHVALDELIMYWHQVYGDSKTGIITNIQALKLYWIFLGKHFFR